VQFRKWFALRLRGHERDVSAIISALKAEFPTLEERDPNYLVSVPLARQ